MVMQLLTVWLLHRPQHAQEHVQPPI